MGSKRLKLGGMLKKGKPSGSDSGSEAGIQKIIYFDEGSAADYVQIMSGGVMKNVTELLDENDRSGAVGAEAKAGFNFKLLQALTGLGASASADASIDASFNSSIVAKSIVTNTVLTDFLSVLPKDEGDENPVKMFTAYGIGQIENSLAGYALLTPFFSMLRSGQGIPAGDFNISVDKLDSTLKNAKGYFEFLGEKDGQRVIFRFNNSSFKNNYKASDLMRMDLTIYAVKVGTCSVNNLDIDNEFKVGPHYTQDNPDYNDGDASQADNGLEDDELLDMFDVFLAGVNVHA